MKRFLYIFAVLFCHVAFADLEVEWIDENTIRVWGTGDGGGQTVVTNWLGCCTNCTLITPAELNDGMYEIISNCDNIIGFNSSILSVVENLQVLVGEERYDISSFRRFGSSFPSNPSIPEREDFTNYVYSSNNTQASLVKNQVSSPANLFQRAVIMVGYNNGIYDYSKTRISHFLNSIDPSLSSIASYSTEANEKATQVKAIANRYIDLSECPCGDDVGDGVGGCAWTAEQIRELLGYVDHIDQDQHRRFDQLYIISNSVVNIDQRMDSYAKLVSGVLYQDGTIVVDDGENSWSNVYQRGYSDLYDYDKSNILQRIELLLFGVSYNTSTNWGDSVESVEDTSDQLEEKFSQAEDMLRDQSESLKDDVELIQEKFTTFVNRLNFFGAGHLGEFSLIDPLTVFDAYTFDVDSAGFASDLGNLQQVSRTCFQIFYWVSAVLFMVWFWWSFIRFVINHVFTLVKFFNNLLT